MVSILGLLNKVLVEKLFNQPDYNAWGMEFNFRSHEQKNRSTNLKIVQPSNYLISDGRFLT